MSDQVRTIRLYGRLGAKFGRVHRFAVSSAAEAIRALCIMIPDFEAYLYTSDDRGEGYTVFYNKRNLGPEQLHDPVSRADIRIAPVMRGAKKQGWGQIIGGIVMIVIGLAIDYFSGGTMPVVSGYFYKAGFAMIVGGVIQMLTPMPKGRSAQDRPENQPSYSFNGPINTQAQGNPVPLLYGEMIVGSAVISAGITTEDQAIIPTGGSGDAGGGGSSRYNNDYFENYIV